MGRLTLVLLLVGVGSAASLAAEHGEVVHYGGVAAKLGFWFMGACVLGCALLGWVTARRGDYEAHRRWMIRFVGSMWGSYWLFRAIELLLGPLLRAYDAASILVCIWASAPLGILVAEISLHRKAPVPLAER